MHAKIAALNISCMYFRAQHDDLSEVRRRTVVPIS